MADSNTTPPAASQQFQLLSATYKSPHNPAFTHECKLPAAATDKPKDRTAYLGALRKATAEMQEHINKELTLRMEEDQARQAAGSNGSKTANRTAVDDAKEEDNYGEEVVDEED